MLRLSQFIFIFLSIISTQVFADHQQCLISNESRLTCPNEILDSFSIEAKVGYFLFSDSKMRKIYNQGGLDVQLQGSFPISKFLQLYVSTEYLERHGKSLNGHQKTRISEIPVSLGVKPVVPISKNLQYYATLGPRYFFVHVHNHSSYVDKNIRKTGLGGFVNTGFNVLLKKRLWIDIFAEYSYGRLSFHSSKKHSYGNTTQIGGYVFGAGLRYDF